MTTKGLCLADELTEGVLAPSLINHPFFMRSPHFIPLFRVPSHTFPEFHLWHSLNTLEYFRRDTNYYDEQYFCNENITDLIDRQSDRSTGVSEQSDSPESSVTTRTRMISSLVSDDTFIVCVLCLHNK